MRLARGVYSKRKYKNLRSEKGLRDARYNGLELTLACTWKMLVSIQRASITVAKGVSFVKARYN